jgi:hypothetical protein
MHRNHLLRSLSIPLCLWPALLLSGIGCVLSAGVRLALLSTSVDGTPAAVSPTAPISTEWTVAPDADTADETTFLVVRGAVDSRWAASAAQLPLPSTQLERLAPGRVRIEGRTVRFVPARPLLPRTRYTLVVTTRLRAAGLALLRPILRAFTTGDDASGAPVLSLLTPADGTSQVVRNLRIVTLRFSRPVSGVDATSLRLVGQTGAVPASLMAGSCPGCYQLLLTGPLAAGSLYRLDAGPAITDAQGVPPFLGDPAPGFMTGDELRQTSPLLGDVTATSSSGCLVAQWTTDPAADSTLCLEEDCTSDAALMSDHELALPIPGDPGEEDDARTFTVASRDESTAPAAESPEMPVPPASPRQLVITEVLSRPLGPWPAQQFVEVWNRGSTAEMLDGLELADEGGRNTLPAVSVPPGGRALIVPADYQPSGGPDPAPAKGTVLARVAERTLGKSGIRADGEVFALRETDGRLVSRFSTYGLKLAKGQSAVRALPCDLRKAYAAARDGRSSPGKPDAIP